MNLIYRLNSLGEQHRIIRAKFGQVVVDDCLREVVDALTPEGRAFLADLAAALTRHTEHDFRQAIYQDFLDAIGRASDMPPLLVVHVVEETDPGP